MNEQKHQRNPVRWLRIVGLCEGASFLLLLCGAMPLKYLAGEPQAVRVVGWLHGVLFIAFAGLLLYTTLVGRWPLKRTLLVLAASLLPFGPFAIDRRMTRYIAEMSASNVQPVR